MPQFRLTYFDSPGRAESIRMALHFAGFPFEDRRVNFADFMAMKEQGELPLGSLPVLEVDGVRIVQTAAILRYVARLGGTGLYPDDVTRALLVDSVLDTVNDTLTNALLPSLFERDTAKKLEMRAAWSAGPLVRTLAYVEGLLGHFGGPFVGGDALSIADIVVARQALQIRDGGLDGVDASALEPYPRVAALVDAYLREPRVMAYMESRAPR